MMSLYIEKGEPTRQGWKRLRIFLAEYYNPDWVNFSAEREPHDHEFFTFKEIQKLPIRTLDKVETVKKVLSEKLGDFYPELKDPTKFRLREKLSDKLA